MYKLLYTKADASKLEDIDYRVSCYVPSSPYYLIEMKTLSKDVIEKLLPTKEELFNWIREGEYTDAYPEEYECLMKEMKKYFSEDRHREFIELYKLTKYRLLITE